MKFCCTEPKHYIAKAKTKRRVGATYRRVEALTKTMRNSVRVHLFKGIHSFKKKLKPKSIGDAFASRDYSGIMETIPWKDFPPSLSNFQSSLSLTAMKAAALIIPSIPEPKDRSLRFDLTNPALHGYVNRKSGELIVAINNDAKENVRNVVTRSFNRAMTPDRVAKEIRSSIGLLPRQEQALSNYREALTAQGTDPDKIDILADKYADRLLDSRCRTIARTETRRATNFGQLQVWKEGARQGFFDKQIAKKIWVVDGDPCDICEPMDGEGVGLDESWVLDDGSLCDLPSDSHPNCLCGMELDFGDYQEEE